MGKDRWDAILASTPLNSTAGSVVSRGFEYEPSVKITCEEWDAPPKLRTPSKADRNNPSFVDLAGHTVGRLTVLGLMTGRSSSIWAVRCVCGKYLTRRAKAIRNPANSDDRCSTCRHTAFLSRSASGEHARRRASSSEAALNRHLAGKRNQ